MTRRLSLALAVVLACAGSAPARAAASRGEIRRIFFTSDRLSAFWGAPIEMKAAAYVPARCRHARIPCPVLYHLPAYGGSLRRAWTTIGPYARMSARSPRLTMAHVFLDPSFHGGYSYFTDSPNNGPWSSALTEELIPYLEALLEVGGSPGSRFLTGHSSGGWTVMWLQVSHPDFFRAVWAVSPDPLDFRRFYEVDVTPGSTDSFYTTRRGAPRYLTRDHGVSMRRLMRQIDDHPSHGGIISSYEFAWSPRGDDGLPRRFFDRRDGSLDEQTLEAWHAFDVHALLREGGRPLKAMLDGRINIYCGTDDDFFYDEPTAATCRFLHRERYAAVCRLVPGRTHTSIFSPTSLYPRGLKHLILSQAAAIWRREAHE
jgi:hypothetical protein